MPRFDRTGPQGMGPRTGRGFGPCGGFMPFGWGLGRGMSFGSRGSWGFLDCPFCGWCNQPQSKKDQLEALSEYKKALEKELAGVENQVRKLSKI